MGRTPSPRRRDERELRERWDPAKERDLSRREDRRDRGGRFNKPRSRSRSVERRRRSPERRRSPSPFRRRKSSSPGPSKTKSRNKSAISERPIITPQDLEDDKSSSSSESEYRSTKKLSKSRSSYRRSEQDQSYSRASCDYCSSKNHTLYVCEHFLELTRSQRKLWARESKRCFKCLRDHYGQECPVNNYCRHCEDEGHNTLLCLLEAPTDPQKKCCFCYNYHSLYSCKDFIKLTPWERRQWAIKAKYCFKCLRSHLGQACKVNNWCKHCNGIKHNTLLCDYDADDSRKSKSYRKDSDSYDKRRSRYSDEPEPRRQKKSRRSPSSESEDIEASYSGRYRSNRKTSDSDDGGRDRYRSSRQTSKYESTYYPRNANLSCFYCTEPHTLKECRKFLKKTPKARRAWLETNQHCLRCLFPHGERPCELISHCIHCNNKKHNSLICDIDSTPPRPDGDVTCNYCDGPHSLYRCTKFLDLKPKHRKSWATKGGLCLICLRKPCSKSCDGNWCKHCLVTDHNTLVCDLDIDITPSESKSRKK